LLNENLLGAGVVDPAGAAVEVFCVDPNGLPPDVLFRLNNELACVGAALFALLVGVDAPASSFFVPKLKPHPPKGVPACASRTCSPTCLTTE
jgi:hypothetical protein